MSKRKAVEGMEVDLWEDAEDDEVPPIQGVNSKMVQCGKKARFGMDNEGMGCAGYPGIGRDAEAKSAFEDEDENEDKIEDEDMNDQTDMGVEEMQALDTPDGDKCDYPPNAYDYEAYCDSEGLKI